jgi:hypothetical protein
MVAGGKPVRPKAEGATPGAGNPEPPRAQKGRGEEGDIVLPADERFLRAPARAQEAFEGSLPGAAFTFGELAPGYLPLGLPGQFRSTGSSPVNLSTKPNFWNPWDRSSLQAAPHSRTQSLNHFFGSHGFSVERKSSSIPSMS